MDVGMKQIMYMILVIAFIIIAIVIVRGIINSLIK